MTDKPKGRFISKAEYARHKGVNKSQVTRAVASGRIRETKSGTIEWRKADLEWDDNRMDSLAFTGRANNTRDKDNETFDMPRFPGIRGIGGPGSPEMDVPDDGPRKGTRAYEDYREKVAKADWAELRVLEKKGQLLDRNDVIAVYGAVLGSIKTGVVAMPQRISLSVSSHIRKWLKDHNIEVTEGALAILEKTLQEIVANEAHFVLEDLAKRMENVDLEANTIAELKE